MFVIVDQTIYKFKLTDHCNIIDDGFKLTYLGYDFLALKAMSHRESISCVGKQIGVGKESGKNVTNYDVCRSHINI